MAITNHDRVGKMLELLRGGLQPFVERELKAEFNTAWFEKIKTGFSPQQIKSFGTAENPKFDIAILLDLIWHLWNPVFSKTLGHAERTLVSELRDVRNAWAHQGTFCTNDAHRAIDSASRILTSVSAPQSDDLDNLAMELLRVRFNEQVRTEKRRAGTTIESQLQGILKPWRDVVSPHKDVASGNYQQAEFAADLWQVYCKKGVPEYLDPIEFFRRTYLTESLKHLLTGAVQRLTGKGGDPVIQLQTNFGGGKTHSMLALYHMVSGIGLSKLPGIESILKVTGTTTLPAVKRVVIVGNKISPGNPIKKADGTIVRTLWGELAYQLGGKEAFELVRADDEKATSPGDRLTQLFNKYGPCLILIDEWVAYARQLHEQADLPAGTFETHFTFAQTLTESAKAADCCLVVISLPASHAGASVSPTPNQADDAEVGGERGREALSRLRNAIGRVEASWRPATAEEGFEIVRRRLFEPMQEQAQFVAQDAVAKAFSEFYRENDGDFPPDCKEAEYERRLKAAYPIHPEVFDRLYNDWSTLLKFQRTRGVLRLMAAVIHSLWEKGDKNPLIMPANLPIEDQRVQDELTRYLSDNWVPVIEKDVDGNNSLPLRIDGDVPNLGKLQACRRIARTIFLGSAPMSGANNRGLEERRIKLGSIMPGDAPALFTDALRRLAASATYLYQDSARYWYSTQPTVTKLADDRAEQLKSAREAIARELERRLRENLKAPGDFCRVHPFPQSSQDVPDEQDARLVVLGIDAPYSKEDGCAAITKALSILETRGSSPRLYRNTLVFLAVDQTKLQDLEEAVRRYLAWTSIVTEQATLNLTAHQLKQAENQKHNVEATLQARIPEAYQWLLIPTQDTPQAQLTIKPMRLSGQEALAVRAAKKLRNEDLLITGYAASPLKIYLDRIPLWRGGGNHVQVKQLVEDFSSYVYLPRLRNPQVLLKALSDGICLLTWPQDSFAFADGFDEIAKRYQGLRCGQSVMIDEHNLGGIIVRADVARTQHQAETLAAALPLNGATATAPTNQGSPAADNPSQAPAPVPAKQLPKRFHASVDLNPLRTGRDAGQIGVEVLSHLLALPGAEVKVTLEIEASLPSGATEQIVRTVTENARTLNFRAQGFEKE